jgi:hypothetical protein
MLAKGRPIVAIYPQKWAVAKESKPAKEPKEPKRESKKESKKK